MLLTVALVGLTQSSTVRAIAKGEQKTLVLERGGHSQVPKKLLKIGGLLHELNLRHNMLTEIPEEIELLRSLCKLALGCNRVVALTLLALRALTLYS
jgi:hypothetical protein